MRCPVDNETLVMADRSGVEIDYCPKCRGVWLDRGELDKIIDRASPAAPTVAAGPEPVMLREPAMAEARTSEGRPRHRDDDDDDHHRGYRKKRRESFLGELFDF
jgi:Zn-finger nucleic acid-binding protein